MNQIIEAKKKQPAITSPEHVQIAQLEPGAKHALKIKISKSENLQSDVKAQIAKLELSKKKASQAKNILMVDQIAGLQDQLIKLEKKINAKILTLKKQLNVVPPDVALWLSKIQSDCTEYLAQVKKAKKWLYRGASGPNAFVAKSWLTRKPKDSDREAQVFFDQMLAQLGFVALRGNSIFTTSDFWHAKSFGNSTYVIFPVNGASHYTYTNQNDLVLDSVADVGIDSAASIKLKKELLPHLLKIQEQMGKKVPASLKDVIFHTQAHWFNTQAHWTHWLYVKQLLDKFIKVTKSTHGLPEKFLDPGLVSKLITPAAFQKNWQPMQTDLAQGLKKEREVYVSGVYYALDTETYGEYIASAFKVPVHSVNEPRKW